uniref:Uncharacterized protein n=1 Tax=Romanomermis culicivorax TaxID=13658 RepID=A0A915J150_ROMCU
MAVDAEGAPAAAVTAVITTRIVAAIEWVATVTVAGVRVTSVQWFVGPIRVTPAVIAATPHSSVPVSGRTSGTA